MMKQLDGEARRGQFNISQHGNVGSLHGRLKAPT